MSDQRAGSASRERGGLRAGRTALLVLAAMAACLAPAYAQFTSEETARRAADEDFLSRSALIRSEEIGEGVTKPYKLFLKLGDREDKAVWKDPSGVQFGFLESWKYEIAAYRLDKLLGLNMVPPAVERKFRGRSGAAVIWVVNRFSLLKMVESGISIPAEAVEKTNRMKWLARAWDSLIGNEDRTQQNVLYTEDWRTILIDHSRSFRSSREFTSRLMFGRNGIKRSAQGTPWLFRRLPRRFVDVLRSLTEQKIAEAVGNYLSRAEIRAIMVRRGLLLKEIEAMISESGEAQVIYDD